MIRTFLTWARTTVLALSLGSGAVAAQTVEPEDSLVLVLNLISSTHARPTTGVVLASDAETDRAMVMVSASFVGAGDEIIVLDGGNDIVNHGRATRTVGRSAILGVALLEVEGLDRPGIALSLDEWPGSAESSYRFIAWPEAGALAEGAAMIRQNVSAYEMTTGVSGPLFDRCGNLAAFYSLADEESVTGSQALAAFLEDFEFEAEQEACIESAEVELTSSSDAGVQDFVEEAVQSSGSEELPEPTEQQQIPTDTVSSLGLTPLQRNGLLLTWVVLALLAMVHYSRRKKRQKPLQFVFERQTSDGRVFHHPLKLKRSGESVQFARNGLHLNLRVDNGRVEATMPENENAEQKGLMVGGTTIFPGERILLKAGQQIVYGDEAYGVKCDPDEPELR